MEMRFKQLRERVDNIKENYPDFERIVNVPDDVQLFVFHVPVKYDESLCGLVFPKKDYDTVSKLVFMWNLNKVENPKSYVGVNCEFHHPLAILEIGLHNLDKSPFKILYDNGIYVFTKKQMLRSFSGVSESLIKFTGLLDVLYDISNPEIWEQLKLLNKR